MYQKYHLANLVKNRLFLLVVALLFAVFFSVQYLELPYGNAFFSFFYAGKSQVASVDNFPTGNSSSKSSADRNLTSSYGIVDATKVADGKEAIEKHTLDSFDVVGSDGDPEDESPSWDFIELNNTFKVTDVRGVDSSVPEEASKDPSSLAKKENTETIISTAKQSSDSVPPFPVPMGASARAPSVGSNASSIFKDAGFTFGKTESAVVSFTEMNDMLISSLAAYRAKKPKWASKSDQELLHAKSLIERSSHVPDEPSLHAPLFRNFSVFKRSYDLMEQTLKVYIYKEGEKPIFHTPLLKGIYASEGWFMKHLKSSKKFVTKNPKKAHLFYLPFSSRLLEVTLYVPNSHDRRGLFQCLNDYLSLIRSRYSFWNRTGGADHFLVACHDWAPSETTLIMANCIRALCNSVIKLGFHFGKDVSLATTFVKLVQNPLRALGGQPPSKRRILAFFAGSMHGYLRPILLQHWENKDPDMKIFGRMPKVKGQMSYIEHMKSSKYCICAKGYEVNSPRVVEAIFYECVPVIISDNYVPPLFETLNWESFAVFVPEKDIPNLKNILVAIPEKRYLQLQRKVKLVQQHFLWHSKPVKYDLFHMILHSIWYTRVSQLGFS